MVIEKGTEELEQDGQGEEIESEYSDPRKKSAEQTAEPEEDLTVIDDITPEGETEPETPDDGQEETPATPETPETDDAYMKRIEAGQGKNVVKEFQGKFAKLNKEIEALKSNKPEPVRPSEPVMPDYTRVRPYVDTYKKALEDVSAELKSQGLEVDLSKALFDPLMSIVFNAIHTETDFKINKDFGNEIGTIRKSAAEKNLDTAYTKTLKSDEVLKFEATKYEAQVKDYIKKNFKPELWDKDDLIDMAFHKVMTDIRRKSPAEQKAKPTPKISESRTGGAPRAGNTGGILRSQLEDEADKLGIDLADTESRTKLIKMLKIKQKYGG